MKHHRAIALFFIVLAVFSLPAKARAQDVRGDSDRRGLLSSAKDAYKDQDWKQTCEVLQKVLDLPDLVDPESKDNLTFHQQANRVLGGFSTEALEYYHRSYGGRAETALKAVSDGSKGHTDVVEKLGHIAARFLYTPQGQDAVITLLKLHLSRGDGLAASQVARHALSNPGLPATVQSRLNAFLSLGYAIAGQEKESRDAAANITWPLNLNGRGDVEKTDFEKYRDERQKKTRTVTERDLLWFLNIWQTKVGGQRAEARAELQKIGEKNFTQLLVAMTKAPAPWDEALRTRLAVFQNEVRNDTPDVCIDLLRRNIKGMCATPDASRFVGYGFWDAAVYDGKADLVHSFLFEYQTHPGSVSLSNDGKLLLVPRYIYPEREGEFSLWAVDTQKKMVTLRAPTGGNIYASAITQDKAKVITADQHGHIRIWDLKSREVVKNLNMGKGFVVKLAVTADGKQLVAAGADGVAFWNLASGKLLHHLRNFDGFHLSLSLDGRRAAVANREGNVVVFDVATHAVVARLRLAEGPIAISPDGSEISFAAGRRLLSVVNISTEAVVQRQQIAPPDAGFSYVGTRPTLVRLSGSGELCNWNPAPPSSEGGPTLLLSGYRTSPVAP